VLAVRIGEGTPAFDAVICGPARRHLETAALVGEGLSASGLSWPTPTVMPGFDEHDGHGLVTAALAWLHRTNQPDEGLLKLAAEAADPQHDRRRRSKAWQLLFEAIMSRWIRDALELDGVESWASFDARVCDAFAHVRAHARGEVALFTSVGPIAVMLARVLELPAERAFEQAWRLYNCSITRIVYSGVRMTLDGFNEVAHLPHQHWTHR
jgi:broad specificity phosphatase PhoE